MEYNLSDICEIQQGRNVASSDYNNYGRSIYLSLKDVVSNDFDVANRTDLELHPRYYVQPNDVLFSIRGKFQAYILPEDIVLPVIASSMFVILRPNSNLLLRSYLWWFLNHPTTQDIINRQNPFNSRMPFISLRDLRALEIQVPSIDNQRYIMDVYYLHLKEVQLSNKIITLKKQLTQAILLNSVKS